ncbi:MAG: acyltransferase domain-containing protein, partial [Nostoc sp.]
PSEREIVFMFPGQGSQYVEMGRELYQTEPIFREQVDLCCQLLQPHIGLDLRSLIYQGESESEATAEKLQQTDITQPALFVIEYALAQLWMSWGISPSAMIGHSIGEYVAACLAGVMSLEDALALVAARGRLMQQLPSGAMLSVPLPEEEVKALLDEKLSLAA